ALPISLDCSHPVSPRWCHGDRFDPDLELSDLRSVRFRRCARRAGLARSMSCWSSGRISVPDHVGSQRGTLLMVPQRVCQAFIVACCIGLVGSQAASADQSLAASLRVEVVADQLDTPWGLAFLPDGRMLVTERTGALYLIDDRGQRTLIKNVPPAFVKLQGGLLDVVLHPAFETNSM